MDKQSKTITITLGIICAILTATVFVTTIQYNSVIEAMESTIDSMQNQIQENNKTIASLNLEIEDKNLQIENITNQKNQIQYWLNANITSSQKIINEIQDQLTEANQNISTLTNEKTDLGDQIEKFESVLTFNTSKLETLVFHVCEKDFVNNTDVNSTYNQLLSYNNDTYEIVLFPEYREHQNLTAELEWISDNFQGPQGIPIMLEVFGSNEGDEPITRFYPENITNALEICNVKYLRFAEVISWHMEHMETFPETYVQSILEYAKENNLKIFWTEWKMDHLQSSVEVFTKIQTLIQGYEDIVTVSFSTNSGEAEPYEGFLVLNETFTHWGASIQPWYWDTRYEEDLENMPLSLLTAHALVAKSTGAEIIQFEPYWYFFDCDKEDTVEETNDKLETLFEMLK